MAMSMSGDSDTDFATMMNMDHQKGLELARKELAKGKSPEMKAMSQKIVDAQTQEIAGLDKWLAFPNNGPILQRYASPELSAWRCERTSQGNRRSGSHIEVWPGSDRAALNFQRCQ